MDARRSKISLLCTLAMLAATGYVSRAEDPAPAPKPTPDAAAPRQIFGNHSPEDLKDPRIVSPAPEGVPCPLTLSEQEIGELKRQNIYDTSHCLPQSDAFKQAVEAASYLAHYQQEYSSYSQALKDPERKKSLGEAFEACVVKREGCDGDKQGILVAMLVQYNFGKELKAQMLENQLHAENMKSLSPNAQTWKEMETPPTKLLDNKGPRKENTWRKLSFRLDPNKLKAIEFDKLSNNERTLLGQEFNREFGQFVNEYTSSTGRAGPKSRWYYAPARTAAIGDENDKVWLPEGSGGKAVIREARRDYDIRLEQTPEAQAALKNYKEKYGDAFKETAKPVKTGTSGDGTAIMESTIEDAYTNAGFGLPKVQAEPGDPPLTPKEIAAMVVRDINRSITRAEEKALKEKADERFPSSLNPVAPAGDGKNTVISVNVDVKHFDEFLDQIWPSGVKKP